MYLFVYIEIHHEAAVLSAQKCSLVWVRAECGRKNIVFWNAQQKLLLQRPGEEEGKRMLPFSYIRRYMYRIHVFCVVVLFLSALNKLQNIDYFLYIYTCWTVCDPRQKYAIYNFGLLFHSSVSPLVHAMRMCLCIHIWCIETCVRRRWCRSRSLCATTHVSFRSYPFSRLCSGENEEKNAFYALSA